MVFSHFARIETFLTIAREKSFTVASKKLGISQPAATQQIKLLEEYFQTPLFIRSRRGLRLTEHGKEIYKIALKLEREINKADQMIKKRFNCTPLHKRIKPW